MISNTFVIGDVHGCFHTLQKLVSKLPENADLIFVGDLCDKGHYSKDVVDFVYKNGYRCVLGNHDSHMLQRLKPALMGKSTSWDSSEIFAGGVTVDSYRDCDEKLINEH